MEKRLDVFDVLFGLFLCAIGVLTLLATRKLTFGSPADMGPGFMPRVLALGLLGFGLVFTGRGFLRPYSGIGTISMRPLIGILGAVAVFALTASVGGLALASLMTILVAGIASRETRFRELIPFAIALSAAASLLFVKGLSLPTSIWPW